MDGVRRWLCLMAVKIFLIGKERSEMRQKIVMLVVVVAVLVLSLLLLLSTMKLSVLNVHRIYRCKGNEVSKENAGKNRLFLVALSFISCCAWLWIG